MKMYARLMLVLLIVCSVFICGIGEIYAKEISGTSYEEMFVTEEAAEVPDTEAEEVLENDADSLPDETLITEDAEIIDSAEEDVDEQYVEIFDDFTDNSYTEDIQQPEDEGLSGSSGYALEIVWLDGGEPGVFAQ